MVRGILGLVAAGALVLAIVGPPWEAHHHGQGSPPASSAATPPEARAAATDLLQAWVSRDRARALRSADQPAVDALFSRPLVSAMPSLRTCQPVGDRQFDCRFEPYKDGAIVMRTGQAGPLFRVRQVLFSGIHP